MPKYIFKCDVCSKEHAAFTSRSKTLIACECGGNMLRELPSISGQEVREVVDAYSNVKHKQNQKELIKSRNEEHYWEVEVPRLVQQYSLETCLEQKWLTYNEKGELIINKPPSKR